MDGEAHVRSYPLSGFRSNRKDQPRREGPPRFQKCPIPFKCPGISTDTRNGLQLKAAAYHIPEAGFKRELPGGPVRWNFGGVVFWRRVRIFRKLCPVSCGW